MRSPMPCTSVKSEILLAKLPYPRVLCDGLHRKLRLAYNRKGAKAHAKRIFAESRSVTAAIPTLFAVASGYGIAFINVVSSGSLVY